MENLLLLVTLSLKTAKILSFGTLNGKHRLNIYCKFLNLYIFDWDYPYVTEYAPRKWTLKLNYNQHPSKKLCMYESWIESYQETEYLVNLIIFMYRNLQELYFLQKKINITTHVLSALSLSAQSDC